MKRVERRGTLELARAGSQPMMMMMQPVPGPPSFQARTMGRRPTSPPPAIASLKEDEGHRAVVVPLSGGLGKRGPSPGGAARMEVVVDGETDADGEAEVDGDEGDHEEYEIEDDDEGAVGRRGAEVELLEAVDAAEAGIRL